MNDPKKCKSTAPLIEWVRMVLKFSKWTVPKVYAPAHADEMFKMDGLDDKTMKKMYIIRSKVYESPFSSFGTSIFGESCVSV